jgi:hypothetical protein
MNTSVGRVELIIGPMFAGKTTELLRLVERAKLARLCCVVMKFNRDVRYSVDCVATHDKLTHAAIPCETLMPHLATCLTYDVIAVDEGQFFSDLLEFTDRLTALFIALLNRKATDDGQSRVETPRPSDFRKVCQSDSSTSKRILHDLLIDDLILLTSQCALAPVDIGSLLLFRHIASTPLSAAPHTAAARERRPPG